MIAFLGGPPMRWVVGRRVLHRFFSHRSLCCWAAFHGGLFLIAVYLLPSLPLGPFFIFRCRSPVFDLHVFHFLR